MKLPIFAPTELHFHILWEIRRQAGETFHDQAPAEANHPHSPGSKPPLSLTAAPSSVVESQNPVYAIHTLDTF